MIFQNFRSSTQSIGFLILWLGVHLITGHRATANNTSSFPVANLRVADNASTSQNGKSADSICPAQLPAAIEAIANRSQFSRARWGISIQTRSPARTLYSRDAQRYFIPASGVKLLTTAAALHQLGSEYRIRTSVYGRDGVLRVVGRGDPSLTNAQLQDLARQLKQQGIREVRQLIVEEGYFQGQELNPTWEWEDVYAYYGTPVNSLILNENALLLTLLPQAVGQPLQVKWGDPLAAAQQWQVENESVTAETGSKGSIEVSGVLGKPVLRIRGQLAADSKPQVMAVAIPDPAQHFLQQFRLALTTEGIRVQEASVASKVGTGDEPELAAVESPPLATLSAQTNQPSNNLYAETLLRSLGVLKNEKSQNTAAVGLEVVQATLTELGVDPASYILADGAGLSRHNLVSPEALVQTLRGIAQTPQADTFRASLPVAGVSGTLRNRFRETAAQNIVQAKTGTMSGVVSLSGYLDAPNYEPLVFSIIVNQSDQTATPLRQAVDEMVLLLTRLRRC